MLIHRITLFFFFVVGTLLQSASQAGILWDENLDGTLSTDHNLPTVLGNLQPGVNSVLGAIERATTTGNVDVITFQVPAWHVLTEIKISNYISEDAISVLGMNNDNFFPFGPGNDPGDFNNTLTPAMLAQIIGVAQFGDGWPNSAGFFARDLLQSGTDVNNPALLPPNLVLNTANSIGSRVSGTKAFVNNIGGVLTNVGSLDRYEVLGTGTYTIFLQQQGENTEYQLDLYVEAVPEPSSLLLVGLFSAVACVRRRR